MKVEPILKFIRKKGYSDFKELYGPYKHLHPKINMLDNVCEVLQKESGSSIMEIAVNPFLFDYIKSNWSFYFFRKGEDGKAYLVTYLGKARLIAYEELPDNIILGFPEDTDAIVGSVRWKEPGGASIKSLTNSQSLTSKKEKAAYANKSPFDGNPDLN